MPNKAESIMAFLALCQSVLLGSFAAILAAHRSEILDKPENSAMEMTGEAHGAPTVSYEAPGTMA
jgi:hypothetical protein